MRIMRVMTVLALIALAAGRAQAATNTWNKLVSGNASGSWTNAATPPWSTGALPGATDTASFNTLDITADSTVTLDGNQSINALVFGDTTTSSAANWILSGGSPSTSTLTLGGTAPTITVNALGNGKAATISAVLAGTAGMTKAGAGTLTLSGSNTLSGGVTLSTGTLNINSTNALGTGNFTIGDRSSSVTINNTSGSPITNANNNPITINTIWRGCTFTGTSDLNLGTGAVTFYDSSVTVSSGTVTFGGAFTNSGMGNLQKYGGGTLTLNNGYTNTSGGWRLTMNAGVVNVNANSYGDIYLNGGRLNINGIAWDLGYGSPIINSGTLDNTSATLSTMTMRGGYWLPIYGSFTYLGSGGSFTVSGGNIGLNASPTITVSNNTLTLVSPITGAFGLTKAGAGTLTLNGANTYTGAMTNNAGTLILGNVNALGFGGIQTTATGTATVNSGSTLDLNGMTLINEPFTLNGTGTSGNGALINSSGTAASIGSGIAGAQLPGATTGSGYSSAPTVAISGTGSGATATASLGLTTASITSITGGGTGWAVNDTVTVTGGGGSGAIGYVSSVNAGVITGVIITNAGTGYTTAPTGLSKLVSASGAGTLTVSGNANNFTVGGIKMTAAGSGYTGTPTYTFGSGNATPGTVTLSSVALGSNSSIGGSGNITINAVVSGGFALTKVGAGTLTLTGTNTYSGATAVSNGVLRLTHNLAVSAATDVYIAASAGAKVQLDSGTTTIHRLYVDGVLQQKNKPVSKIQLPTALDGLGYFLPTDGTIKGTLIRVF